MADAHDILQAAARIAAGHLDGLTDGPVWRPVPAGLRAALTGQELPEQGLDAARLLDVLERDVLAYPMGNGHPAFFGWVNAAPHPAGVAGALLAAAMNPSSAGGDHADVHLERAVVRWIAELVGFPHELGAGLLTSGASMATIVAVGAARQRALAAAGWDVRARGLSGAPRLVAYGSEEVHSCVRKAVELLGIGSANLHVAPVDETGRLQVEALRRAIAADRAAGAVPFLVVGSAGTVSTGAVDSLDELAAVAAEEGLWFHVDGAYGGLGVLDPAIAHRYAGMDQADSLALDPHKWLQVPAGVGCLLVRDRAQLRETFSYVPAYLRDDEAGNSAGTASTASNRPGRRARFRCGRRSRRAAGTGWPRTSRRAPRPRGCSATWSSATPTSNSRRRWRPRSSPSATPRPDQGPRRRTGSPARRRARCRPRAGPSSPIRPSAAGRSCAPA